MGSQSDGHIEQQRQVFMGISSLPRGDAPVLSADARILHIRYLRWISVSYPVISGIAENLQNFHQYGWVLA